MELLRESLPVLLGAGVPLVVNVGAGLGPRRLFIMAALVFIAGAGASVLNGELTSWPSGLFAVMFDSTLAGLGALMCLRVLRRRSAVRGSRLRTARAGNRT
jgi:hypothetical protein